MKTDRKPYLESLYRRVSHAIHLCKTSDNPAIRRGRHLSVSYLEQSIANLIGPFNEEGEAAFRGAVSSMIQAELYSAAVDLAERYLELELPDRLRTDLYQLRNDAEDIHERLKKAP